MTRRRPHSKHHDLLVLLIGATVTVWLVALALYLDHRSQPAGDSSGDSPAAVVDRDATRPSRSTVRTPLAIPPADLVRATPSPPEPTHDRVTPAASTSVAPEGNQGLGSGGWPGYVNDALACIRAHESDSAGGYTAVNVSSGAAGAYQLMPQYSDDWAVRYGHGEVAHLTADLWPPAVQDSVAAQLYMDWPGAWAGSGC